MIRNNNMPSIQLTKGQFALVDIADYKSLSKHKWICHNGRYAARRFKGKYILMHRAIMKPRKGFVVDHINGNGLDNNRSNLRICTQSQNCSNSVNKGNSKYRGTYRMRDYWQASIKHNYKKIHLGTFRTQEEAARCYDKAAVRIFGIFARTNFKTTPTGV